MNAFFNMSMVSVSAAVEEGEGWFKGRLNGIGPFGLFPGNYVRFLEHEPKPTIIEKKQILSSSLPEKKVLDDEEIQQRMQTFATKYPELDDIPQNQPRYSESGNDFKNVIKKNYHFLFKYNLTLMNCG